jgi:hypothetical protein
VTSIAPATRRVPAATPPVSRELAEGQPVGQHPSRRTRPSTREVPVSARLQILATEHWSLLATRALTWNESFSRSSMFLAALSGAVVALALAAQATAFGPGFVGFALVVLPVVLFIGLATFIRLVAVNREDFLWVQGMNRLRHAYLDLAPDLEPYFVAGWHDDEAGVMTTFGATPGTHGWYHHVLVTIPAVVAVLVAVVGGSVAGLASHALGAGPTLSVAVGVVTLVAFFSLLALYEHHAFQTERAVPSVRFPSSTFGSTPHIH